MFFIAFQSILLTVHVTVFMRQQAAQVYFPKMLYMQIKVLAAQEEKPMAAWIRDLTEKEVKKQLKKRKSLAEMPTFAWGDDPTISQRIDEIVYPKDW
ncbi:hypothetical protein IPG41_05860 [Candidatus Peregrinibacteria bacterium]|nr:MAG: hypothetical protein IPG41_05860 [Candidatus Peregrinibacteria bacterium]